MGRVWAAVGNLTGRGDVAAHGVELLGLAPQLYHDLHASLNMTVRRSASGERCWQPAVEVDARAGSGQHQTWAPLQLALRVYLVPSS